MATTTNYGWTTPDDTALVKDGAAAIRSLGTSIDTTTKNLNPSTTLGDIEYRSGTANTNTRLAIGSTNQTLSVIGGVPAWANSSTSTLTTTGDLLYASAANTLARRAIGSTGDVLTVSGGVPTWAAPAAASSNFTLLNSGGTALTGAQTVTVSGISNMDKLFILVTAFSSASASSTFYLRLNGDTAANYRAVGWRSNRAQTAQNWDMVDTNIAGFAIGLNNAAANTGAAGIFISGCKSSGLKIADIKGTGDSTDQSFAYNTAGYYNSSSTISSISIFSETGNLDGGTVFVYGSAN